MARADRLELNDGTIEAAFHCPGCKHYHSIPVTGPKAWTFNGDFNRPTFQPSILVRGTDYDCDADGRPIASTVRDSVCHSFVTDGRIQFLADSTHALAGQTVDLPEE